VLFASRGLYSVDKWDYEALDHAEPLTRSSRRVFHWARESDTNPRCRGIGGENSLRFSDRITPVKRRSRQQLIT
jgi:hypothetical protein